MAIVLLGFMGAGKTTVSNLLEKDVEQLFDMDTLLEERFGMSIAAYFAAYGESAFRQAESALLEELLAIKGRTIIATGGGVVLSEKNRDLLRKNRKYNVLLSASFEVLYARIEQDTAFQRPLFLNNSKEDFHGIYERRMEFYEDLADLTIQTDRRTPEEIVRIIKSI